MSDSFISLVPSSVKAEEADKLAREALDWLIGRRIVSPTLTDCIFGEKGYAPGERYQDIIIPAPLGLRSLQTNGLDLTTRREVFHSGGNDLQAIRCPACKANNIASDWGASIQQWWSRGENDNLKCMGCQADTSITDYIFEPTWAFGELGMTFWNWPPLTEMFITNLTQLLNKDIKIVHGRL